MDDMDKVFRILEKYFGYKSLKDGQYEIIKNIISKRDTLGVLPTGGGKSLCYQIPAVLFKGVTIVISPLISLMKDQVDNILSMGIRAAFINSTLEKEKIIDILKDASIGEYNLIYISPERLESLYFKKLLCSINVSQIAIDEAHCISTWGHDFRKSYKNIKNFIDEFKERPVISAFTATATNLVKEDIKTSLNLKNPFLYEGNIDRENLTLLIKKEEDKLEVIKDYIRLHEEESIIIYCSTRKEVDGLYEYLYDRNYSVSKYHAGLKDSEKDRFQEEFLNDNKFIMIATNAFGMGIDKSNVRAIIHFTLPKSLEMYYQEIGRGGRDGGKCECILLYSREDIRSLEYIITSTTVLSRVQIELKKLMSMVEYCETDTCLRCFVLKYFGHENEKSYCLNCSNCLKSEDIQDLTIESQKILSCIYRTKQKVGRAVLIDILRGLKGPKIVTNKYDELSTYGIMKEYSSAFIKTLINELVDNKFLDKKEGTYSMYKLNDRSIRVLKGEEKVMLLIKSLYEEKAFDQELFKVLKILRKNLAREQNVKPYIIFSDSTLIEISNIKPKTKEEFMKIRGIGEKKWNAYGIRILKIINSSNEQN